MPASRIGHTVLTAPQLKALQEGITFTVFAVFSAWYLREKPTAYDIAAFSLIMIGMKSLLHVSLHVLSWGIKSPDTDLLIKSSKCTQYTREDCSAEFSKALATLSESIRSQPLPTFDGVKINLGNWNEGCPAIAPVTNLALF